ncbi:hypothetical protein ACNKHK_10830 [Shigella flexneri]
MARQMSVFHHLHAHVGVFSVMVCVHQGIDVFRALHTGDMRVDLRPDTGTIQQHG